jgi:secreted PhoX family phosphatase
MGQQTLDDVIRVRLSRRDVLMGGLGAAAAAFVGASLPRQGAATPLLGFTPVPVSRDDAVVVPPGYGAHVVFAWGDPVSGGPEFRGDASNSAAEQALQAGMHHDGMHFFSLPRGSDSSSHGLLAINHEYTDDGLLHTDGMTPWTAEKVAKSRAAHGVSVIEVRLEGGRWTVVRPSRYARRITGDTPIYFSGPAAGHTLLRTAGDPSGRMALGTLNNCASGVTPWGTYLTCEENWGGYFVNSGTVSALHARYNVDQKGWGYRWHEYDPRFDAGRHPNEPNRFGWVVEIDPFDPTRPPVKRTALGRMAHEGATLAVAPDHRVVCYLGDDGLTGFEHIYKFVSARPYSPGLGLDVNAHVLDHGTLYAARFNDDGSGEWVELTHGRNGLTPERGFASPAEVVINARGAADLAGATFMDRPEWVALHPVTQEVYCTLTNNARRGAPGQRGPDRANPRAKNVMGHVIRWREAGNDPTATRFEWDIFLLAGDPAHADPNLRGNVRGETAFACPDGLWFDQRGVLWIQTDVAARAMAAPDWARIGNNQMLAADPTTGEVRRFLTGPSGSEVTGLTATPDLRTLFVNIQHPGEPPVAHPPRNDPGAPKAVSAWPEGERGGRPRSATIAIRRADGGMIGA